MLPLGLRLLALGLSAEPVALRLLLGIMGFNPFVKGFGGVFVTLLRLRFAPSLMPLAIITCVSFPSCSTYFLASSMLWFFTASKSFVSSSNSSA